MARLDNDPTASAFWAQIGVTKGSGVDHLDALRSTIAGREPDSAADLGALLAWRLSAKQHMAWTPRLSSADAFSGDTYLDRSPAPESVAPVSLVTNTVDAYARQLAVAMDARIAELGQRTALQAPQWATQHLGAVPQAGTSDRETWEAKAGRAAGYRERFVTSQHINVEDPIGPAPSALRAPDRYADWKIANDALGIIRERGFDVGRASDQALQRAMDRWTAESSRAPAYVRHERTRAQRQAQQLRARYVRLEAALSNGGERSRARLGERRVEAEEAERYVETLQEMNADRADWYEATSELRTTAREAEAELDRRYPERSAGLSTVEPEELTPEQLERFERRELSRSRSIDLGIQGPSLSR